MKRPVMSFAVLLCATIASADAQVVFKSPGWCVWCPSAVALPDGRYALVHSRWLESDGFEAWCAKSEAALAVSEAGPLGPYKSLGTILKGSGRNGDFDRDVRHHRHAGPVGAVRQEDGVPHCQGDGRDGGPRSVGTC